MWSLYCGVLKVMVVVSVRELVFLERLMIMVDFLGRLVSVVCMVRWILVMIGGRDGMFLW